MKSCPVLSQIEQNALVTYQHTMPPCLYFLSFISLCLQGKNPSFDSPFPIIPRLIVLTSPLCSPMRSPQLYAHEEYVITGESRPDRWLCVKPQCSPGRVILARAHYQINNPRFFCVWASLKSLTDLLLPLSLYAFLSCSVFVFPSGVPDVPGYMPLSSWVLGTKSTTRKRWRLEVSLKRTGKMKV